MERERSESWSWRRWLHTSPLRQLLILGLDGLLGAFSLWLGLFLRFEGHIPHRWLTDLPKVLLLMALSRLLASTLFRIHRWSFRFSGLTDGARVALSGLFGTGLFLLGIYLSTWKGPPRSVVVLELLMTTALMTAVRFTPRLAWMYQADRSRARKARSLKASLVRTLVIGAGASGEMLLRDLQRSEDHNYQVIGFVDDDRGKWGTIVCGKPVLGGVAQLPRLVPQHQIAQVLIAIPNLDARRVRELLTLCADLKLRFKVLPVSYTFFHNRHVSSMLQDLSPEDLLPREPVTFAAAEASANLAERTALVTGGAGSIGSEICEQLLHAGLRRLVLVDMNENGMYLLKRRLMREYTDSTVVAEVADVRDGDRVHSLFQRYRPQDVFHAAAHKHVPLMERAPGEAVKNNVLGTRNVALAAHRSGAERFVFISTDKAVRPTSVMGATKKVGEMVVRAMAKRSQTRFTAVRFGNVLDSAGSVVPLFREQIAAGGPVTVTHPDVRRYFMTIDEAVGLVLKAAYGNYGELCVLEMGEQMRILDLARHMIIMSGLAPDVDVAIEFMGLRPGEKLAEELLTEEEEQTRHIDHKIAVAESPPPPADLEERLEALARAAAAEDAEAVRAQLRRLVPSYQPESAPAVVMELQVPEPAAVTVS